MRFSILSLIATMMLLMTSPLLAGNGQRIIIVNESEIGVKVYITERNFGAKWGNEFCMPIEGNVIGWAQTDNLNSFMIAYEVEYNSTRRGKVWLDNSTQGISSTLIVKHDVLVDTQQSVYSIDAKNYTFYLHYDSGKQTFSLDSVPAKNN